jgi:hypothetical protein
MNDQLPTDQRQLEKATQRQPLSSSGATDLNVLAARQAWLAMGKAAEGAGRDGLNEQALLASLQSQLLKTQPEPKPAETPRQVDWSWAAVAIAATVLVAATIIGARSQRPDSSPNPGPSTIAQPAPSPPEPVPNNPEDVPPPEVAPAGALVGLEPAVSTPATSTWTDLDEAIESTYVALQKLGQQRSGVDQSLTDFDTQLKQLSADIAGESL